MLDGKPISYEIKAGQNNSFLMIEVEKAGRFQLRVMHGKESVPTFKFTQDEMIISKRTS